MKKPNQRHFPYQHPVFGTEKRRKGAWNWERTIYFLWWSYLQRNEPYRQTCEQGGIGECEALYGHFGDVRGDDFKAWWTDGGRGARLFAEPETDSTLQVVSIDTAQALEGRFILISVPLHLPKKSLLERFRKVLAEHHKGHIGEQYAKSSRATFRFEGHPKLDGLAMALKVYDYAKANPNKSLWEMRYLLPDIEERQEKSEKDGVHPNDFKRTIEATISRYKRKAAETITNVGLGFFPCEPKKTKS